MNKHRQNVEIAVLMKSLKTHMPSVRSTFRDSEYVEMFRLNELFKKVPWMFLGGSVVFMHEIGMDCFKRGKWGEFIASNLSLLFLENNQAYNNWAVKTIRDHFESLPHITQQRMDPTEDEEMPLETEGGYGMESYWAKDHQEADIKIALHIMAIPRKDWEKEFLKETIHDHHNGAFLQSPVWFGGQKMHNMDPSLRQGIVFISAYWEGPLGSEKRMKLKKDTTMKRRNTSLSLMNWDTKPDKRIMLALDLKEAQKMGQMARIVDKAVEWFEWHPDSPYIQTQAQKACAELNSFE